MSNNRKVMGAFIPDDDRKKIREIMDEKGMTASQAIRAAVALYCAINEAGR